MTFLTDQVFSYLVTVGLLSYDIQLLKQMIQCEQHDHQHRIEIDGFENEL
jgi:hypothetical protein